MKRLFDLAVKVGEYTTNDGEERDGFVPAKMAIERRRKELEESK